MDAPWIIHRAKLRQPRRGDGLVLRPRLTSSLDRALRVPLTLVTAPAGFGKTTLLAEWTATHPTPIAWLAADLTDRDLTQFVVDVVAAIETVVPGIGELMLALLQRPHPVPAAEVGASLADELLDLEHEVVLVIDDFHLADSADVELFLGGLLPLLPPTFHLVLATRTDPTLPLARLRVQGHVNELRAAELRFDEAETRALLALAGLADVDPALVTTLLDQTEGWVALLRLAALVMPAVSEPERLAEGVTRNQHLMNFLAEEVLTKQSVDVQDFLLHTAIVDRIRAPLADALLDYSPPEGSGALLARLARENFPLEPTGDEPGWFRYHPLFHSLLRHQLGIRGTPSELAALHGRAGAWFAANDHVADALRHLLAAGDTKGAARLVEDHAHLALNRDDWTALADWLRLLPQDVIHDRPALLLATAYVAFRSGRAVPMRTILAEVETLLARPGVDAVAAEAMRGEIDALTVAPILPIEQDPTGALALARRAIARVPPDRRLPYGFAQACVGLALQATGETNAAVRWLTDTAEREAERIDAGTIRVLQVLMWLHRQAGNIDQCVAAAQHLLALGQRHDLAVSTGWAHVWLAWIAYEADDLDAAIDHYLAILADHRRVHFTCHVDALTGLTLAYQGKGMHFEADNTLQRLREIILGTDALEYLPALHTFEARLALLRGRPQDAIRWLSAPAVGIDSSLLHEPEHALMTRINVLLAEGSPESLAMASRAVDALRARAEASHHRASLPKIQAQAALVLQAQGQGDAAVTELRCSLQSAATMGLRRTYLDLGSAIVPLLQRLTGEPVIGGSVQQLLSTLGGTRGVGDQGSTPPAANQPPTMADVLTEREAEVLAGLVRRLSYQEIAAELFISLNTVKSHAANIYRKLDVPNRRQALLKAHVLGWSAQP
ncbi:MAG TPA: LuxR C-terminal-related transcriptional regulator [Candidatus Limnocylindria bacterium]|nr:LuxR C-terminal-related transcriptional regulator [Candidatus Limnocylindria bacterium]